MARNERGQPPARVPLSTGGCERVNLRVINAPSASEEPHAARLRGSGEVLVKAGAVPC